VYCYVKNVVNIANATGLSTESLKIAIAGNTRFVYLWTMEIRHVCRLIGLIGVMIALIACDRRHHGATASFYYWKTAYEPDRIEKHALAQIGAKRLFVRIMDIDTQGPQGEAVPVSAITFREPLPDSLAIVPVVYILNNVLKDLSAGQQEELAGRIIDFVTAKVKQAGKTGFDELQIDCDWTASTRDAYFGFLKAIRARMADSVRLSATLRLHQVRNRRSSGVPPVDRTLLMCYNMGNLRKPGEHNSIIDLREMDTYLKDFLSEYPLPMDMALPLFSWSVVFRKGQYTGISKRLDPQMLSDTSVFARDAESSLYRLKVALPAAGLQQGDVVRREQTRWEDLSAAADFLARYKRKERFTLLFYHLDNQVFKSFSDEQLQEIVHRF